MHDLHLPRLSRDDLLPPEPAGMGRGLLLALAAHVLLMIAIAFGVHWNSSDPAGVEAELWSAVPQIAAQRSAPPEPEPEPAPPPKPEPRPVPKHVEAPPPPKPLPDPQIAIEKEKARQERLKEEKRREEEKEKAEKAKREKAEQQKREEAKKLEEKKLEEKRLAEKKKQDAAKARSDELYRAQMERMRKQLPGGKSDQTSGGASSSYAGRILAAVKPNITFTDEVSGNPTAEVEVRQSEDGTILGSRLVKSSGVRAWDEAVLRAVEKTQKLPRDIDGNVVSPVIIEFKPK